MPTAAPTVPSPPCSADCCDGSGWFVLDGRAERCACACAECDAETEGLSWGATRAAQRACQHGAAS